MPITHISYGESGANHSTLIGSPLRKLEEGLAELEEVVATMALMLTGDGQQEAHFTSYIIVKFGFPDAATAKAAWDELNSLKGKLTTNGSVIEVNAALHQAFNKFR